MRSTISQLITQRMQLITTLESLPGIGKIIGGNHANFILAPISGKDGKPDNERSFGIYKALAECEGVVVRYRGTEVGCEGCVRITVGTEEENRVLVEKLSKLLVE